MADISKIQIQSGIYDVKDQIARNEIENVKKNAMKFPNFFIAPFFSGYGNTSQRLIRMYISLDGIHFNATNFSAQGIYTEYGSDMSIVYDKTTQTFFLAMTSFDETKDALIFSSKDFKNWEKHSIDLGYKLAHNSLARWAPALFVDDDGTMYLSLSTEYKKDSTKTYFKQELYKCTNKETLIFEKIGQIALHDVSDTSNYIDGTFAKRNNIYYFIVKHENSKAIELYSTSSIEALNSYSLINDSVAMENVKLESPSITFTDTTANIYTENYIYYQAMNLQQCKIRDFPNITKNMILLDTLIDNSNNLTSNELYNAKHGNVMYVTDDNAKLQILNNCDIGLNSYNAITKQNRNLSLKEFIDANIVNANKIVAYPNVGWDINGLTGDLNIEVLNPYNQRFLHFYCGETKPNIKINAVNNITTTIEHQVTDLETNNIITFDLAKSVFLEKQLFFGIAGIENNLNDNINITTFFAFARSGMVSIDMIINVKAATSGNVTIAKLKQYLPKTVQVFSVFANGMIARLNANGDIIVNTLLASGTYHATVSYVL